MNKFLRALKSKTLWFATAVTSAGVVQAVTPFIPPQYVPLALAGVGVVTGLLRTVTTQPLSEK